MTQGLYGTKLANILMAKAKEATGKDNLSFLELAAFVNQNTTKGKIDQYTVFNMHKDNAKPSPLSAAMYAEVLGIDVSDMIVFNRSWDTAKKPKAITPFFVGSMLSVTALPFILRKDFNYGKTRANNRAKVA
jgi:hypothetical protein